MNNILKILKFSFTQIGIFEIVLPRSTFSYSKSIIETPEQCVEFFQS